MNYPKVSLVEHFQDSNLREVDRILTTIVWNEHHPVSILVNNEIDYSNTTQLQVRYYFERSLQRITANCSDVRYCCCRI